jgi:hypothetical protein
VSGIGLRVDACSAAVDTTFGASTSPGHARVSSGARGRIVVDETVAVVVAAVAALGEFAARAEVRADRRLANAVPAGETVRVVPALSGAATVEAPSARARRIVVTPCTEWVRTWPGIGIDVVARGVSCIGAVAAHVDSRFGVAW